MNIIHRIPQNPLLPVQLPPPEFSPPPDDMDFNDGENNPGPYEEIQGNAHTLRHPILNGMSFIRVLLFYFQVRLP
jgi:hypothetical protein